MGIGLGPARHVQPGYASHGGRIVLMLDPQSLLQCGAREISDIACGKDVGITRPKQRVDRDPVVYIQARSFRQRDVGINTDAGDDGIDRKAATVAARTNNELGALPFDTLNVLAKANVDALLAEIEVEKIGEGARKMTIPDTE